MIRAFICVLWYGSQELHIEGKGSFFVFDIKFIFATGRINNTRKIRNDMFPLDENSQSKSISPRARTFGDPFTFSCSNYQEIHTRSQHPNLKLLNNTRLSFMILIRKRIKKRAKTKKCYQKIAYKWGVAI